MGTLNLAGLFLHNVNIHNRQTDILIMYVQFSYGREYNLRRTNSKGALAHHNGKSSFVDIVLTHMFCLANQKTGRKYKETPTS